MLEIKKLLESDYRNLSYINRFSGAPLQRPENVAEHTFYVIFLSWLIALDLEHKGYHIDIKKVFEKATIHDFEEAMSGDITQPFKYSRPALKRQIDKASESLFNNMLDRDFPLLKKYLLKTWGNCKDNTMEGRIVALADLLSVLSYTTEEIIKGNLYMSSVRDGCYKLICTKFKGIKEFEGYIQEIREFLNPVPRTGRSRV